MSTMIRGTTETSVTFSLAELAKIEEERVREQDAQRARTRDLAARQQREAEAQRRATEAGRIAAEAEARARRERGEAEAKARLEAREQARLQQVGHVIAPDRTLVDRNFAAYRTHRDALGS